jgi:hypothetical protein
VATLLDGEAAPVFEPVPYVWSDQYDAKIFVAGRPRAGDTVRVVDGDLASRSFVVLYGREGRLVGALSIGRVRRFMEWRRVLRTDLSFDSALAGLGGAGA